MILSTCKSLSFSMSGHQSALSWGTSSIEASSSVYLISPGSKILPGFGPIALSLRGKALETSRKWTETHIFSFVHITQIIQIMPKKKRIKSYPLSLKPRVDLGWNLSFAPRRCFFVVCCLLLPVSQLSHQSTVKSQLSLWASLTMSGCDASCHWLTCTWLSKTSEWP